MSIIMNLYYTGTDGSARKFAEEMERSGTAALIRQESGNERYSYFFPMDDPETVLLIDIWKDQQALDLHHASPMMEKSPACAKNTACICGRNATAQMKAAFLKATQNI